MSPRSASLMAAMAVALGSCAHEPEGRSVIVPEPPREFRAVWVATVANIDWPSKPGLPVEKQQEEALAILERAAGLNLNAVVLQVRPHADALYASGLEPWSSYLTGRQGVAPEPFYDPLAFWVTEAHRRGLALHAWINPYRANHPSHKGELAATSFVRRHPDRVAPLGKDGYWWMIPTDPVVQQHGLEVVLDIVRRYDIDGIHLDDYFYPYPSYHEGEDFPDGASWARYVAEGGGLAKDDWRRDAVDRFIESLHHAIKEERPSVEFGISPFGIWRPGHPAGIQGFDQYGQLYADARRWLREGWVDYFTPQLYWPIAQVPQSFPVLLGWWMRENVHGRHLWPGTSIARLRADAGATELINQVMITRGMMPESPGLCLFSAKWLMGERDTVGARLGEGPWREPALIPASPWLDSVPPPPPVVEMEATGAGLRVRWTAGAGEEAFLWLVCVQEPSGAWTRQILAAHAREILLAGKAADALRVAVSAVDRSRNIGEHAICELRFEE